MKSPEEYVNQIKHQYVLYSSKENKYRLVSRCLENGVEVPEPREICVVVPISCLEKLMEQNKEEE